MMPRHSPLRVALLAPVSNSLYARLIAHLASHEPDIALTDVVVRTPWTWRRIRGELARDGRRLALKVYQKLVLGEHAYDARDDRNLRSLARRVGLPDGNLRHLARRWGFRLSVVKDHNDERARRVLAEAKPDVIVFAGGGLIRAPILDLPTLGTLNCHMGVLPEYRGMDVVEWPFAEAAGLDSPPLGITLHFMDRGVDTGPLLLERRIEPEPGDTFASIRRRLEPLMVELMLAGLRGLRDGACSPQAQASTAGRQYYVMHPRTLEFAAGRLSRRTA